MRRSRGEHPRCVVPLSSRMCRGRKHGASRGSRPAESGCGLGAVRRSGDPRRRWSPNAPARIRPNQTDATTSQSSSPRSICLGPTRWIASRGMPETASRFNTSTAGEAAQNSRMNHGMRIGAPDLRHAAAPSDTGRSKAPARATRPRPPPAPPRARRTGSLRAPDARFIIESGIQGECASRRGARSKQKGSWPLTRHNSAQNPAKLGGCVSLKEENSLQNMLLFNHLRFLAPSRSRISR